MLDATAQIVIDDGYGAATIAAITTAAGTSKPAFYRRFSGVAELVPALVERRHSLPVPGDTGSLAGDLRAFQTEQAKIFNDPFVRAAMPGWLAHMQESPEDSGPFVDGFLPQRMAVLNEIVARAEARGEAVRTALDMDALMEACVGPFLMRSLIPQSPPIRRGEIERTVDLACLLIEQARQAAGDAPVVTQPASPPDSGGRIRPHG
ncbi:TetR-like C-terminal domain-containing protein [Brevibacterium metallidurans]